MDDMKIRVNSDEVVKGTNRIRGMGKAVGRASIQQGRLTKNSKRFTMGIQQAGFQVGDFAAQVQNGTSAMVALGQQGPQLLGIFGAFGAIAGAALAIGTAIIKAKNAGKELQFDFKGIGADLKKLMEPAAPAFEAIGDAFKWVGGIFASLLNGMITGLAYFFTYLSYMPKVYKEMFGRAGSVIESFNLSFLMGTKKFYIKFLEVMDLLPDPVKNAFELVLEYATGTFSALFAAWKYVIDKVKNYLTGSSGFIANTFRDIVEGILSKINYLIVTINNKLPNMMKKMPTFDVDNFFGDYEDETIAGAGSFLDTVKDAFNTGMARGGSLIPETSTTQIVKTRKELEILGEALREVNADITAPLQSFEAMLDAFEGIEGFDLGKYFKFATKEAKKSLKELKTQADMVRDSLSSSIESAMMSMIDGTKSVKDAFKAMAVDIIKELYRIYVVKQITGMITGAIGGEGPPPAGSFKPKANGGPVSAGSRYIVGERGPEVFTPAMSGTITPNSGGGGETTIVQNINVSTGVQQTVRAEIRQMMPQIADSAKGAVLDAKRRGGSYGRAMA
jgi:hypothetical protein